MINWRTHAALIAKQCIKWSNSRQTWKCEKRLHSSMGSNAKRRKTLQRSSAWTFTQPNPHCHQFVIPRTFPNSIWPISTNPRSIPIPKMPNTKNPKVIEIRKSYKCNVNNKREQNFRPPPSSQSSSGNKFKLVFHHKLIQLARLQILIRRSWNSHVSRGGGSRGGVFGSLIAELILLSAKSERGNIVAVSAMRKVVNCNWMKL